MTNTAATSSPLRRALTPTIAGLAALALVGTLAACTTTTTSTSTEPAASSVSVDAASTGSNTAAVVDAATAFAATLSADQRAQLQFDYSDTAAKANWSNLPEGMVQRGGLAMGDLDETQTTAVLELLSVMLSDAGYEHVLNAMAADDYLAQSGGAGNLDFSSDNYFISFFGTPAVDSAFSISFGGHHLALAIDYQGDVVSITPEFLGIEPQEFTADDGSTIETMASQKGAVFAMLDSLSDEQLATAELSSIFDDVVMGPGADNGAFPTDTGVLVSSLSTEQQDLVTEAIRGWVGMVDETVAEQILAGYVAAYDETTVMWSGSTDPESADVYVRISGPAVWIEYVHQSGIGFAGIHLHTVYRDATSDYGV